MKSYLATFTISVWDSCIYIGESVSETRNNSLVLFLIKLLRYIYIYIFV